MPIYEFYCSNCHTIYNFLSPKVDTSKCPSCPRCGKPELERQVSLFSISKGLQVEDEDGLPDIDEGKMEQAMQLMAKEGESLDEEDPRQAAQLMRKLYDKTGLSMGPGMEEAMSRLESGEDPDQIEEELGDILEDEDIFISSKRKWPKKLLPPSKDETLYDL